jgi:glycosyltransferase involved in cell wall biosynthesis
MAELPTAIHVIAKLELGGAQRIAVETARRLKGYRNVLLAGIEGPLVGEAESLEGVTTHLIPSLRREIRPFFDLKSFLEIGRIVSRETAAGGKVVVHSHGSKAGVLARLAARRARAGAVVHTIHGFAFHEYQPNVVRFFYVLVERFCARYCDRLVAVSRSTMRKGLKEKIGTQDKYRVIYPAILEEHFVPWASDTALKKRKELGIEDASPVVGTVCCFKPQKAPLDFVEMAAEVNSVVPEARFVMVGDGVLMDAVRRRLEEKKLASVFRLVGWRDDVSQIVATFDVFALTSLWEGLPMVHAEAMSKGKPIVATSVDGTPEAVLDGVNGFLIPPRDSKRLAEKVVLLLRDPELREKMGKAGRKMAFPRFSMSRLVNDVAALYGELGGFQPIK